METNQIIDATELSKRLVHIRSAFPFGGTATTVVYAEPIILSGLEEIERLVFGNLPSEVVSSETDVREQYDRWSRTRLALIEYLNVFFHKSMSVAYSESGAQAGGYSVPLLVDPEIEGEPQVIVHPKVMFGARPMPDVRAAIRIPSHLVSMIPHENLSSSFRINLPEDSEE